MPTHTTTTPQKTDIEQIQKSLFLLDCKDRWTPADYKLRDDLREQLRELG